VRLFHLAPEGGENVFLGVIRWSPKQRHRLGERYLHNRRNAEGGTCEGPNEVKVFLEGGKDETLGFGNPGGQKNLPIIDFSLDSGPLNTGLDFSNGFATIDPTLSNKSGADDFNGITISIPGFTFTDIAFDVQLTPTSSHTESFTISDFTGTQLDATGTEFDAADTDKQFSTTALSGAFTSVDINSPTGFDEIKHIEISGLAAVPEPSTWALMGVGFAALGLLGYRKTRSDNALA
jgi:PEP-CTERM motif